VVGPVPAGNVRPSRSVSCLGLAACCQPACGAVWGLLGASAAYQTSVCGNISFAWSAFVLSKCARAEFGDRVG